MNQQRILAIAALVGAFFLLSMSSRGWDWWFPFAKEIAAMVLVCYAWDDLKKLIGGK
jgi:hypothetical protein